MKVVIIMGSKTDLDHCKKIKEVITTFGIDCEMRVASAHKVPLKVLEILRKYESENVVFITVAGMSNALSGFVDANTSKPVIACPPYSEKFSGMDILSTLRMPSGVAPMTVLEPKSAAIAAIKIFALNDTKLYSAIVEYQNKIKEEIIADDKSLFEEK
jgi:5-(carboxyamino)imidazole ribonucleotide mutase